MEPLASREDIDGSQFVSWYNELRHVSIKSEVIALSVEFIDYLKEDGIILPTTINAHEQYACSEDDSDEESPTPAIESEEVDSIPSKTFPEFDAALTRALEKFGGEVFLKTNWSAPLDVPWMTLGSLKVTSLRDAYLQLKSSDRIMYDLEHMYDTCNDDGPKAPHNPVLVVKKWANLQPSMEFRLFVRDNILVGICPRDCCTFYPFMSAKIEEYAETLRSFFSTEIAGRSLPSNYCIDVYIDRKERVWLIDLNCFGLPSTSLLFEWSELTMTTTCLVKFVENESQKLQSALGSKRGPIDVHMAPDFSKFMDICREQQEESSSDDESER